jgi:transcriptional regulator with XRE-family HTH domain
LYLKAFGAHLKEIRLKKKLSQEEVANSAEIPINQVGRIERGEVNTTISTLYVIANALEIPPKDLLNFKFE